MKSILLSIKPQWVAKILNKEKTIDVRKQFPKDYVGWVYIYCTKDKKNYLYWDWYDPSFVEEEWFVSNIPDIWDDDRKNINGSFNGKVVARFWCDKVETISLPYTYFGTDKWVSCENERTLQTETIDEQELLKKSCISEEQIYKYLNFKKSPKQVGYAIHFSKLEIFDKPKYLTEYYKSYVETEKGIYYQVLTKAPQNYCYIEGEVKDGND